MTSYESCSQFINTICHFHFQIAVFLLESPTSWVPSVKYPLVSLYPCTSLQCSCPKQRLLKFAAALYYVLLLLRTVANEMMNIVLYVVFCISLPSQSINYSSINRKDCSHIPLKRLYAEHSQILVLTIHPAPTLFIRSPLPPPFLLLSPFFPLLSPSFPLLFSLLFSPLLFFPPLFFPFSISPVLPSFSLYL